MGVLNANFVEDTTKVFNTKRGANTAYGSGLKIFSMKPVFGFIVKNGQLEQSDESLALAQVDLNGNPIGGNNLLNLTALSSEPEAVIINADRSVTPKVMTQSTFGKTLADKLTGWDNVPSVVAALVAAAKASNDNAGNQTEFIAMRLEVVKYNYLQGYEHGQPVTKTQKHVKVLKAQFVPTPASPTSI